MLWGYGFVGVVGYWFLGIGWISGQFELIDRNRR